MARMSPRSWPRCSSPTRAGRRCPTRPPPRFGRSCGGAWKRTPGNGSTTWRICGWRWRGRSRRRRTPRSPARPCLTAQAGDRHFPLVVGTLVVGGLVTGLTVWSMVRPAPPRLVRFTVSPGEEVPLHIQRVAPDIAISPDGDSIVYTSGTGGNASQLHLRQLDRLASNALVTGGGISSPFFSSDGQSVGFHEYRSQGLGFLKRVSVQGGPASVICELLAPMLGASWGADGTIVFGSGSGLWQVPAVGGEPDPLTNADRERGELGHLWPEILPDGKHVLFTIGASPIEDAQIAVLSLESGQHKVVLSGGSYPRYSPSGHLLYGLHGVLWAVRFDLDRLESVGDPVPVQEELLTKPLGAANIDVSERGSAVYISGSPEGQFSLVWADRLGNEEPLPLQPGRYSHPRLSPTGDRIAVEVLADNRDLWIYYIDSEVFQPLTYDTADDTHPIWTMDGRTVVFASSSGGILGLFSVAADGSTEPERLTEGRVRKRRILGRQMEKYWSFRKSPLRAASASFLWMAGSGFSPSGLSRLVPSIRDSLLRVTLSHIPATNRMANASTCGLFPT